MSPEFEHWIMDIGNTTLMVLGIVGIVILFVMIISILIVVAKAIWRHQ